MPRHAQGGFNDAIAWLINRHQTLDIWTITWSNPIPTGTVSTVADPHCKLKADGIYFRERISRVPDTTFSDPKTVL